MTPPKLFLVLLASTFLCSCKKEIQPQQTELKLPTEDFRYQFDSKQAKLGRVLFYDKALSASNSISCGDCHQQHLAFSDGLRVSPGFSGKVGERNTPPIQNISENQSLFWDGRINNVQEMSTEPIFNHVEMGVLTEEYLINNLQATSYYSDLFEEAFGDNLINKSRIQSALSAFIKNLVSNSSKFDRDFRQNGFGLTIDTGNSLLTSIEKEGFELFNRKYDCGSCHNLFDPKGYNGGGIAFNKTDTSISFISRDPKFKSFASNMKNIGLDNYSSDPGLAGVTGNEEDRGRFKIPNLRNVELTAPYMHDGRFSSLEEVIDFYSSGVANTKNLDPALFDYSENRPQVLSITESEKKKLIAFLKTLTDYNLISDPKFSNPFVAK